jgi:predicted N-acyltransferase
MVFQFITSITELDNDQWNQVAGTDYPFTRYEFLAALETSGATNAESGWQPFHLIAKDDSDRLIGFVPLYIKTHSYGEYVFDWSWADAYHRNGVQYYPKLLSAIPYTPATGPRFCFSDALIEEHQSELQSEMTKTIVAQARKIGASSWHCLFPEPTRAQQLEADGFALRQGCQFHWYNQDFKDFDDFLATFTSRKRKNLKKERQKVHTQNVQLVRCEGGDISDEQWKKFYEFYQLTYLKRSGHDGYLTGEFFETLGRTMPEHLMMVQAFYDDELVAAALCFKSSTHLFGRYWGCQEEFDSLHFEACYYQGIEYAIERGIQCFDPGAQGEHKIQRGFTPTATWSSHWMADERFDNAIRDFLKREQPGIKQYMNETAELLPFKQE